jgi:RimJ/RimL family protein N-acetyltransferase
MGLRRIVLRADPRNLRALHVYEKSGFREYDRTEKDVYMELIPAR